jgi:hypothetical protein
MDRVCLYTQFDSHGRPLACGVHRLASRLTKVFQLHAKGTKKVTIYEVNERLAVIKKIVEHAVMAGIPLVTTDFKSNLELLNLPVEPAIHYGAYDLCWGGTTYAGTDFSDVEKYINNGLLRMADAKLCDWQKLTADIAPVYQALQNRGLLLGGLLQYPRWSTQTFSGRSKTSGVNAHGLDGSIMVGNPHGSERDLFVHFDWVSADVNVAGWLSGDETLRSTFVDSDPYTYLENILGLDRAECKLAMLSALNKMDLSSPIITEVFPDLGRWLAVAKDTMANRGWLYTVLGRPFDLKWARNELAVINGVFQGSVAHAMSIVLRQVWERFGANLLFDIHDSLITTCYPVDAARLPLIAGVAEVMTRPFAGRRIIGAGNKAVDGANFFFPLKVSIGSSYKQWQPLCVYRESGVHYVANGPGESQGPEEEAA